jgi:pyridoxal phosphate phosphatase PHOSPHO2
LFIEKVKTARIHNGTLLNYFFAYHV